MNFKAILSVSFLIVLLILSGIIERPSLAADAKIGAALAEKYKCLSCHDRAGKRTFPPIPFLRGQHQKYLVRQLQNFRADTALKSGEHKIAERYNHLMDVSAANLSNADINNLAAYFSSQICRSEGETGAKVVEPKLAKACVFCHGEKGRSPFVSYPKIAGQNMGYLIKQLKIMRQAAKFPGEKNARFHRAMAAQVIGLKDAEIVALSYYFSKQSCKGFF